MSEMFKRNDPDRKEPRAPETFPADMGSMASIKRAPEPPDEALLDLVETPEASPELANKLNEMSLDYLERQLMSWSKFDAPDAPAVDWDNVSSTNTARASIIRYLHQRGFRPVHEQAGAVLSGLKNLTIGGVETPVRDCKLKRCTDSTAVTATITVKLDAKIQTTAQ